MGVRLLAITQDIEKLRQAYPDAWGSFLGNAEAIWWMGTNHDETADILSKNLGSRTRVETVQDGLFGASRPDLRDRTLLDPDQVKRFLDSKRGNIIVTRNGRRPLRLKNAPYFKELPVCFYEADRDHRETSLRAYTRSLFGKRVRGTSHSISQPAALIRRPPSLPLILPAPPPPPLMPPPPALILTPPPPMPPPPPPPRALAATAVEHLEPIIQMSPANDATTKAEPEPEGTYSGRWPQSDPAFVRLFEECFAERGLYPHPVTRRDIWEGFGAVLDEESGDLENLQLKFEKWVALNMKRKDRADDVIEFFDVAVETWRDEGHV